MPTRIDPSLIPSSPDLRFEQALWQQQIERVAGLDEAGRGAWAGPVAAAAVIFSSETGYLPALSGIRDSKQLTPESRQSLAPVIRQHCLAWGVGFATCVEIDEIGILNATRLAMTRALEVLSFPAQHLLIDALFLPDDPLPQTALYKGDQRCLSIAAASILAKTARDEWMVDYSRNETRYSFDRNKGYGTKTHQAALEHYGACPQHRFSYTPIRILTNKDTERI